jgi:hypothetical protein
MMTWQLLVALAVSASDGHGLDAGALPVCSNRVINQVVKRAGCTVGDTRCWYRSGGFCTDYVERKVAADRPGRALSLGKIGLEEVDKGDVAVFVSRAHYAYVEGVLRDKAGRVVAVDVSEYNFGTCWVDKEAMVTEKYKAVNRRSRVAVTEVDGGFMRPRPAVR